MNTIKAAEFKQKCLSLLDHLDGEGLTVTKHGTPVAKIMPIRKQSAQLIGCLRKKIVIKGDLFSTGSTWHGQS